MKKSGDRTGRYLIEAPIGAGGMGEVYEVRDTRLGRRVALKLLRSGAGEVDALRTIVGRVKLAERYRAQKRDQDAAVLEAEVDRVWAGADPGLRDSLRALHEPTGRGPRTGRPPAQPPTLPRSR